MSCSCLPYLVCVGVWWSTFSPESLPSYPRHKMTPAHTLSLSTHYFPFFYIFRTTFSSICLPYLVCGGQTFPRVPPLIPTPQNGRAHTLPFKVKQHFHFLPSTFTFFGGPLLAVLACTIWSVLVNLFPWVPPLIPTPQNAFAHTPYNHTRSYYTFTFHPVLSLSF